MKSNTIQMTLEGHPTPHNHPEKEDTSMAWIALPQDATVGVTEATLAKHFDTSEPYPEKLGLDFSACRYIDLETLIFTIALLRDRVSRQTHTFLRMPRARNAMDFLRIWEFPRAVEGATDLSFDQFLDSTERTFYKEALSSGLPKYAGHLLGGELERLLSDRFFALYLFKLEDIVSHDRLVNDQSKRWEESLVRSVIERHLGGPAEYFSSRVVFEALMNSVRHPHACLTLTGSRFAKASSYSPASAGHFTITFWDDGDSIITTLRQALLNEKEIHSGIVEELCRNYALVIQDEAGVKHLPEKIRSNSVPDNTWSDAHLLLSATFPGVTCDVEGRTSALHPSLEGTLSRPGMGLYILLNTVVDVFKGSISIRTKNVFMTIKGPDKRLAVTPDRIHYRAKVHRFAPSVPPFRGNMLTMRFPVHTS